MNSGNPTGQAGATAARWHAAALALLLSLSLAGAAAGQLLTGKVIGVVDSVLDASRTTHRIRLSGIDAPEKAQPFGQRSKAHLSDLVFGKQVEVVAGKSDKYGRTVGKVVVNGMDANLA